MNLMDRLMTLSKGDLEKIPTEKIKAMHLSNVMGEPVYVTVRAISGERYTELSGTMVGKKGQPDYGKAYNAYALIAAEGIVEPNIKDPELMKHFGCATPKDLVKKLFPGGETTAIADKISEISGFLPEKETEDEIKKA